MDRAVPLDLLHDFGGEGPIIHLAHANGFPPATYTPFAETLIHAPAAGSEKRGDYHVIGLPARPLWPGSRPESAPDWHTLADDLIEGLDALDLKGIVGIGHSLGGVYTMLAAVRRSDLFRAVVLIDPVLLPVSRLWILKLMRWLGLQQRLPLVQGALRRRRTWPSRQACYEHFRAKVFFSRWPDASLRAYVEAGTRPRPDGNVALTYPPEWEAHIFATAPTDMWRYVPQLRTPVLLIQGEHTGTFRPASRARLARQLPSARFRVISGSGHLLPMERPAETGALVRAYLDELA